MTERASDSPKDGVYLDAALERVRQEVSERIDRVDRRRSQLRIAATIALTGVALVGGAGIATALTALPSAPGPVERASVAVGCDGQRTDAAAGFFTVTFTLPEPDAARVDAEALCALAGERLADDPGVTDRSPAELLALAAVLIRQADRGAQGGPAEDAPESSLDIEVLRASFGASGERE